MKSYHELQIRCVNYLNINIFKDICLCVNVPRSCIFSSAALEQCAKHHQIMGVKE